jgi:release factor glutamine methyltransferase
MTVLEVLQSATGYLEKNGVESPRLSAEHLLAQALGMRRLDLYLCFDRPVSESERAPLRETVRQRAAGVPLQHIIGNWDFFGRTFKCDARALVPRPETELLAEWVLETFSPPDQSLSVLDIGTGTGVLALTLALERPAWSTTGSDISSEALSLARENAELLGANNIKWIEADLIPPHTAWDVIVSNPPYIPSGEIGGLSREVRHDPLLALDGGADGLEIYRRLIPSAFANLKAHGFLFLEIGADQEAHVRDLMMQAGFLKIEVRRDHNHLPRCIRGQTPRQKTATA